MLSRIVKEHQDKQSKYKEQQEKRSKEAVAAVHKLTQTLVDGINLGVETAYENQRKLVEEVAVTFGKVHEADITMAFTG